MKLLFAGDLCVSGNNIPELGGSIRSLFAAADIVSLNFEAPLIRPGTKAAPKIGPTIHQTDQVVGLLAKCCITHLALANNHIMDYGESGLICTLEKLKEYATLGAGLSLEEAYMPKFYQKNGQNVAFISLGEAQFGAFGTEPSQRAGFAWVDSPMARQAVIEASQEADWVIVQIHAGLEMVDVPLPEWRERFREFIDLGADLVIGHHPHVLQGSEEYKGKMIHYSLGNFYMDVMLRRPNPGSGGLLEVLIDGNEIRSRIIPLKISLNTVDTDASHDAINFYQSLCARIGVSSEYYSEVSCICRKYLDEVYSKYYESAVTGLGTTPNFPAARRIARRFLSFFVRRNWDNEANELMLIHNIRIETHRWVVERALSNRVFFNDAD